MQGISDSSFMLYCQKESWYLYIYI